MGGISVIQSKDLLFSQKKKIDSSSSLYGDLSNLLLSHKGEEEIFFSVTLEKLVLKNILLFSLKSEEIFSSSVKKEIMIFSFPWVGDS